MELTQTQLQYIEWRIDPSRDGTKKDWAAAHGISRDTLQRWDKETWFQHALERRLQELNINPDRVQDIVNALHREARGGNVAAAKLYLDYVRDLMPQRSHIEDRDVAAMSDEELEQAWKEATASAQQDVTSEGEAIPSLSGREPSGS